MTIDAILWCLPQLKIGTGCSRFFVQICTSVVKLTGLVDRADNSEAKFNHAKKWVTATVITK